MPSERNQNLPISLVSFEVAPGVRKRSSIIPSPRVITPRCAATSYVPTLASMLIAQQLLRGHSKLGVASQPWK